jgi:tRNA-specific 2-thiouridylase
MELIGAERLATGHYARVEARDDGSVALLRAHDRGKDQSYALASVPYAALARASFPLGDLDKRAVRAHAERLGLRVWDKPESQDLCFVPDGDYAGFMERSLGETRGVRPGAFLDLAGRPLGEHRGIIHYTIGQRRGLGIAAAEPLYVIAIDAAANAVTLGPRAALDAPGLVTEPANWLQPRPVEPGTRAEVQIRYHHRPAPARITPREDGTVEVRFDAPQSAITPGQACVFYQGDRVLGGAAIAGAIGSRAGAAPGNIRERVAERVGA